MNKAILIVLDGWGYRPEMENNAIAEAKTPFFNGLWNSYPHTLLNASEEHVGLTSGTIGNSEIGHMTMGAGRIIATDLVRIHQAIKNNELHNNPAFSGLFEHVKKHDSFLHVLGLVSPAGVHSHQEHLYGFLVAAKQAGVSRLVIHAFTDGRDAPPQSAHEYLDELEKFLEELGIGRIATASGRYFAMDRDKNWHRTEKAEAALFSGQGKIIKNKKPSAALRELYGQGVIDELMEPVVFLDDTGKNYVIGKNDGVFFFNFRRDRTRQLSRKIMEHAKEKNLYFVTMTDYDPVIKSEVAFPQVKTETTLAAEISKAGLKQSHIAETEKYGHVTFFFNGGRQEPHEGEKHFLIDSRKDIKTHDEAPEMRAKEIADRAIGQIGEGDDFILINFANADMVGHTANKPAIITAVETVDRELKRVVEKAKDLGYTVILTADHGNAEVNIDPQTGAKHTAHTLNQVPCILVSPTANGGYLPSGGGWGISLRSSAGLSDLAPTILEIMGLSKPSTMTGVSLVINDKN